MRYFSALINAVSNPLEIKGFSEDYEQPNTAFIFRNAIVHPYTGVYLDQFSRMPLFSVFHKEKQGKLIDRSRYLRTIFTSSAVTIGHGPWNNYYHWYIDSLPRVFGLRKIDTVKRIELFVSRKLSKQEKDLLQALVGQNIKIRYVNRFALVKAKEAYFLPFLSKSCDAELPNEYLSFFRSAAFKLFPQTPPGAPCKIFISRAGSGRRVFSNQVEVEELFKRYGYVILQLENLTLSQQIYYFRFADRVVASHGAGLTNLLYARHCSVLEIFHSNEVLGHYKGLCKALGLPYAYTCLKGTHKDETTLFPIEDILGWINQLKK